MSKNIKNIIIVAIIVVGGGIGYLILFGGSSNNDNSSLSVSSSSISSENIDSQIANDTAFLSTLLGLSGIKIDSQLFFSKTFSSLSDNTVEIVNNGTIGRENPFAPLDNDTTTLIDQKADATTNIPPVTTITPETKTNNKVSTPVTNKN